MFRVALLFLLFQIFLTNSSEFATNLHKTEWIPITREDILNHGRLNNAPFISDNTVAEYSHNMQILRENAIKVVTPEKQNLAFNFLPDTAAVNENHEKTNECELEACLSNVVENNYQANNSSEDEKISENIFFHKNIRKPKAIKIGTLGENNLSDTQDGNRLENKLGKSNTGPVEKDKNEDSRNSYKVIEDTELVEHKDLAESEQNMKESGFKYQFPEQNINFLPKTNLTSTFLSILHRYNIKPEDQSKNYVLSRNKAYIPKQNRMFVPIPVRPRYNSLNHLPVDPLIAVFLSNYGYYLPSYYGLHNNYRNLYGYLASNNIHNNLPFGLYKIFSDTDSSN